MKIKLKNIFLLTGVLTLVFLFLAPLNATAAEQDGTPQMSQTEKVEITLFHSNTCPHCAAEKDFLRNYLLEKYPEISLKKRVFTDAENKELLKERLKEHDKQKYFGVVPVTFVEDEIFLGFDNKNGVGADIEAAVKKELENKTSSSTSSTSTALVKVPWIGKIDPGDYSLPALAMMFGLLDGFNVCSLGALILVLGLVLTFRDRKKIALFGGAFLGITAVIYGLLIILWHQVFEVISAYMPIIQGLIAAIGIFGGIYFFKEFCQYLKYGPSCDTSGSRMVSKLSKKLKKAIHEKGSSFAILGGIMIFAAALTIIEFPCSAAAPVAFAGILAEQQLPALVSFLYIAIFVLFYLLDELIIFAIAVYKMDVKATSHGKFTTWAVLVEAIALTALGVYYLWGLISKFI